MNDIKTETHASLAGKTVIITGASKGIGKATAIHLASLGVNVVLLARSAEALNGIVHFIKQSGGNALAHVGDVANYEDVASCVELARSQFKRVDILINNAGLIDPISRLADSDVEAWSKVVDVNVKGVYYGLRAVIPQMINNGGTIINISSGAATSALEGWSHYCATKAAVLSLTRCAHKEYGHQGITVVGLSPGTVATDMQAAIRDSGINPVSQLDWSSHIPAEWVAKAIAFLCTESGLVYAGSDFSLKTNEGRKAIGLPLLAD